MQKRVLRRLIIAVIVALTGGESYRSFVDGVPVGEEVSGIVLHVADGDTLRLNGIKIRLWGVNAPEVDQAGYEEAKQVLLNQTLLKQVSCVIRARDKYGRIVAQCYRDKIDVGAEVIGSGWAHDYPRYSKGYYLAVEARAKKHRLGLWRKP